MRSILFFTCSLLIPACANVEVGAPDDGETEVADDALVLRRTIESATGAMVLGSSSDGRRVVYGTACDAGDDSTAIKLLDQLTFQKRELARGVPCAPGSVTFSADGALVAFGDGAGQVRVHAVASNKTVTVSREGRSTIGVAFSPSSKWFVVASADDSGLGATLDAWNADLKTHAQIAEHALFNPFGPPALNVQFSPDGARLLYLGELTSPMPIGTLAIWSHGSGAVQTLAPGVSAGAYVVREDFRMVGYVHGASPVGEPPATPSGDLVVRDLATGTVRTVEAGAAASLYGFAGDRLLYGVGAGAPGAPVTLKAHVFAAAKTVTVDTNVFASMGFGSPIAISPSGDRIAYTRAFDPMRFVAELRVASGVQLGSKRTLASAVVPVAAYGWIDGGRTLAYLHDPTSSMPGATMGTLSAWNAQSGAVDTIGSAVTQIGLRFDARANDLTFVSSYDMSNAAGVLRVWNARTGSARTLGNNAYVMSVQRSADGALVGFIAPRNAPSTTPTEGEPPAPPPTKLVVSRVFGVPHQMTVALDATSHAMGPQRRVVYTTDKGVFSALVL